MSKQTDHAVADAADDISSLFAKLGSQGASAYQDFSGARLSAPEPVAAEAPPLAEPLPPLAPASVPTLSVVRAPAEPNPVVALSAARPAAAEPATAAVQEVAPPASASVATPLTHLFQRLLDTGRDRVPTPDSPLKRFQIR